MTKHLSSEEMERALAGKADAQVMEHVSGCAACAEEMARLGAVLGAFRESAIEMAVVQRRRAVAPRAGSGRRLGMWATVAGAVVFAAVMVPVASRRGVVSPKVPVANGTVATAAVSDAELMTKIQNDLASSVPEPMQALEGTENKTGSGSAGSSSTQSNEKD